MTSICINNLGKATIKAVFLSKLYYLYDTAFTAHYSHRRQLYPFLSLAASTRINIQKFLIVLALRLCVLYVSWNKQL